MNNTRRLSSENFLPEAWREHSPEMSNSQELIKNINMCRLGLEEFARQRGIFSHLLERISLSIPLLETRKIFEEKLAEKPIRMYEIYTEESLTCHSGSEFLRLKQAILMNLEAEDITVLASTKLELEHSRDISCYCMSLKKALSLWK